MNVTDAVDEYSRQGLSIIPILARDKKPTVEWKEYQSRRPSEDELRKWFNGNECNVAVVCGQVSGNLVILDFDSVDDYHRFFNMEKIEGQTPVVRTGRGVHVWFRTETPVRSFKVPGLVDVKADGGYCLVPPSIHPSGKTYEFVNSKRDLALVTDLEKAVWNKAEKLGYPRKRFMDIHAPVALDGSSVAPNCVATLSPKA